MAKFCETPRVHIPAPPSGALRTEEVTNLPGAHPSSQTQTALTPCHLVPGQVQAGPGSEWAAGSGTALFNLQHPRVIFPGAPLRCLSPSLSIRQLSLISIQAPGTESSLSFFFSSPKKEHGFSFKPFVEGGNMSNRDEPFGNQIKAKRDEKRPPQALWE